MKEKTVLETYEEKRELVQEFNLETHAMVLDILAERNSGDIVGIEIQMYEETAPFKRTRYYLSGIDMSILEKGKDYDELPAVTVVYITKKDFVGGGKGCYLIERRESTREKSANINNEFKETINISNGVKERYYNLQHPTRDEKVDELLQYFRNSDQYYKTETFPRIVEIIDAEDNPGVLSKWVKSAAKAGSIAEFEANM